MPVLPLLTPFLIEAWHKTLATVLAPRHLRTVASVVLPIAVVCNLVAVAGWKSIIGSDQESVELWPAISSALDWLETNAQPTDVVAAPDDPMVYLYTSLKSIRPFVYEPASLFYGDTTGSTGTVSDFVQNVAAYRPAFLLYYPTILGTDDFNKLVHSVREQNPGWLVAVHRTPDPRVLVFRFDWNRAPASSVH
jgi:hypothetical protein